MKRIVFRLAVAILTFFAGVSSTKFPSGQIHLPPTFKIAEQSPPIPESKELPQPLVSSRLQKIGDLPEPLDETDYVSLQFIDETRGWLIQDGKLWRTQDGGRSWKAVFTAEKRDDGRDGYIGQVQFINSRTGWLVSTYKMYKTEDGGDSWNVFNHPIPYNYDDGLPVGISNFYFLKDGKRGWVVGDKYRSLTGRELKLGLYPHTRYSSDGGKKGLTSIIFYTQDGGKSWTQQPLLNSWYFVGEIYALDERHAWAVGLAGVFYLQNGKWMPIKSDAVDGKGNILVNSLDIAIGAPTDYPNSIYFANERVGWLINSNGYLGKSVDGGRTWSDVSSEFGSEQIGKLRWGIEVYFADPLIGWGLDGDGKLIETTDGGVGWTMIDVNTTFSEMFFLDDKHGWTVSKEGIYRIILNQ
jgi:photosystem II stability/assembly factor-like uncharacterized protein